MGSLLLQLAMVRYFAPQQFGIFSICVTAVVLVDGIVGGAVDMGILRLAPLHVSSTPGYSLEIQRAGLLLKPLVMAVIFLPLGLAAGPLSRALFQQSNYAHMIWLTALALLGLMLLRSAQIFFQVQLKFLGYGLADLLHY